MCGLCRLVCMLLLISDVWYCHKSHSACTQMRLGREITNLQIVLAFRRTYSTPKVVRGDNRVPFPMFLPLISVPMQM